MSLALPTFCTPIDGPLGSLIADRVVGGDLTLSDPTRLGNPSKTAPIRLSILAADGSKILTQMIIVGVVGTKAFGSIDQGFQDVVCPAGSLVAVTASAAALKELQLSIISTVSALNTVGAGSVGPAGPQGPIGATGETGPQGPQGETGPTGEQGVSGPQGPKGDSGSTGATGPSGLAAASSPLVYDASAQALSLPSLPATILTGVVNTANLGSGSASATTYLRGDGTWAAAPASGGATPAGADGQIQYASGGALAASPNLTFDGSTLVLDQGVSLTSANLYNLDFLEFAGLHANNGIAVSFTPNGTPSGNAYVFAFATKTSGGTSLLFAGDNSLNKHIIASDNQNGTDFSLVLRSQHGTAWNSAVDAYTLAPTGPTHTFTTDSGQRTVLTLHSAPNQTNPLLAATDSTGNVLSSIDNLGGWNPPSLADTAANLNSIYLSSTTGKLTYKDLSGNVHSLYS